MFEFKGDWETSIELTELSKLRNTKRFRPRLYKTHGTSQDSTSIGLKIDDAHTYDPDPLPEQISCINWISENQSLILDTLYDGIINIVFPYYRELWDDEWDEEEEEELYPKMSGVEELNKAIDITNIYIYTDHKEGISNYGLLFQFCTDDGLGIIMHKDKILSHASFVNFHHGSSFDRKELLLHTPHPKYGKLKPWQESENQDYPNELFHADRLEELKAYITSGKTSADGSMHPSFLYYAIRKEKESFIDFLFTQKLTKLHDAFIEALKKRRIDWAERIIEKGYDINSKKVSMSPLYNLIGDLSKSEENSNEEKVIKRLIEYLFARGINPTLKDDFNKTALSITTLIKDKDVQLRIENYLNGLVEDYK